MKLASESLIPALLEAVPELQPLLDQHIRANDEILPHVFFGDVTRFALEEALQRESEPLVRLLTFLELAMTSGDDDVQNVIAVSFLENLGPPTDAFYKVRSMLEPNLRSELGNFWKDPIQ